MKTLGRTVTAALSLVLLAGCSYTSEVRKEEEAVQPGWSSTRQPLPLEQRKKIAVLDFEDQTDYGHGRIGRSASSVLTTYLSRSGQFAIYEREKINQVADQQQLTAATMNDAGAAAAVGRKVGLDLVIIGTVTSFGYKSRREQACIFSSKVIQVAEAVVDVRLIEVSTGRIVSSESGRGSVEVAAKSVMGFGDSAGYDETMATTALRAAISKFVDKLIDQGLDAK